MPTGGENVRSWGQSGSDRPTLKTALLPSRPGEFHLSPSQVGSRTGAPTPSEIPRPCHVSSPRHVERGMRISRTALPHLLHVEAYETYPAGATFGSAYSIVPSRSPIAPEHTYVYSDR